MLKKYLEEQNVRANRGTIYFMGEKRRGIDKEITKCNCEGIALFIENKKSKVRYFMQGDVPYMSLPSKVNFSNENPSNYLKASYDTVECTEKANHYIKLDFKKKNGMLIV